MTQIEIHQLDQLKSLPSNGGERWLAFNMLAVRDYFIPRRKQLQVIMDPGTFVNNRSGKIARPDGLLREVKAVDPEDPVIQLILEVTTCRKIDKPKQWNAMQDFLMHNPNSALLMLSTCLGEECAQDFMIAAIESPQEFRLIQQDINDYLHANG